MKDKFKNAFNKNKGIKIVLVILFFGILILSVTYAYFDFSDIIESITKPISASGTGEDQLIFSETESFSFSPGADNLDEGMGNYTSSASISATLYDYDRSGDAYDTYNVYYYISTNEYVYTTDEEKPELILTIIDPEGNEITSLAGLTYYPDENGLSGFDVTGYTGVITISTNNEVFLVDGEEGVLNTITDDWSFKVSMVNLDTSQYTNTGKTYESEFILSLDELTLSNVILIDNGGKTYIESKGDPDFSSIAETNEGMYATEDDYGTSYYFRGAVDNNWVVFGEEDGEPIYWRIIRIDGSDNIRMIYSGTTAPTEDDAVTMESDTTQITYVNDSDNISTTSTYNGSFGGTIEVEGTTYYMYKTLMGAQYVYTAGEIHGNSTSSVIKTVVDDWFDVNIKSSEDDYQFIATTTYCNDRTYYTDTTGTTLSTSVLINTSSSIYFGAYTRRSSSAPSLSCLSTDAEISLGIAINADVLELEVALITADEVMFAGAKGSSNSSYYLYTNQSYWTLSPSYLYSPYASVFYVYSSGYLTSYFVTSSFGVRPVVSLTSGIFNFSGTGTYDDPYKIE